ncbi:MAG: class I SAM-dependent methyltransferase [Bacteroidetes bacterium]|nr:class I SAM-dependent methyltransferase [Bacteroidota bacterium]
MFEVPATSAFVLSFANQEIYRGAAARTLLSSVDLSAADPIRAQFEDIHDEITMEILNRKYGVAQCCRKYLDENPTAQVIHLGGGLDPLPIDLAESYPKAHFFDVDMANMSLKEEINQKLGGPDVSFLTANLADIPSLTEILSNAGWDSDAPTLLVSEGISYYIPKEVYRHTLTSLQTSSGCLVFEYSVPDHILVGVPKAEIVFDFFERFTALLNMPIQMQRYDDPEVRDLAAGMNGEVVDILTQHQLEFSRTGRNEMRDDPRMGAIRIALIHLH